MVEFHFLVVAGDGILVRWVLTDVELIDHEIVRLCDQCPVSVHCLDTRALETG